MCVCVYRCIFTLHTHPYIYIYIYVCMYSEYCMVPGTQEGRRRGTLHRAILCVRKIQVGNIKEVFRAKNRID